MSDTPIDPLDDPASYGDDSVEDTGDIPLIDDHLPEFFDDSDVVYEEGEEIDAGENDGELGVGPGGTIVAPIPGPPEPVGSWSEADEDGSYEELAPESEEPVDASEEDVSEVIEIDEEDENPITDSGPTWTKYEVWGRDRDAGVEWELLSVQDYGVDAEAEIEGLRTSTRMEFRVRLMSSDNLSSEWSSVFYYTLPADLTPPPAPTAPSASDSAGFITHTHDGSLTGPVPEDMSHRVLYAQQMHPAGDPGGEPGDPMRITEWRGTGATTITTGRYVDRIPHRAWLIAVDTTGNESDRSEYTEFMPSEPVDVEALNTQLDVINGPEGRLPALEQDLDGASSEILALKNTTVPAINSAISGLNTELGTAKGQITTLNSTTIPQINSTLGALNTDLTNLFTSTNAGFEEAEAEYLRLQGEADAAKALANTAQGAAQAASTLAGGKGRVFFQPTAPGVADRLTQNLWIDTTGGNNTPKRWSGSAWVVVTDKAATDAATAAVSAATAASNADAKAVAAQGAADAAKAAADNLRDTVIPGLQAELNTAKGQITTLNNTTIPAVNSALATERNRINTLNNATIPGINTALGGANAEINTLKNATIPGINSAISGVNASVGSLDSRLTSDAAVLARRDPTNLWPSPRFAPETGGSRGFAVYSGTDHVSPFGTPLVNVSTAVVMPSWPGNSFPVARGERFIITLVLKRLINQGTIEPRLRLSFERERSAEAGAVGWSAYGRGSQMTETVDLGDGWERTTWLSFVPGTASDTAPRFAVPQLRGDNGAHYLVAEMSINRSVSSDLLVDGAVSARTILAEAVTAGKIAANAVTAEKINALAITAEKIASGAITTDKLMANAVTVNELAANAVNADKIAANAVTTAKLAAGSVIADKLATNSVTAVKILANAVTAGKIAAEAVNADKIAANAVTAVKINAGAVGADKIAANAVTAEKIAAQAVDADKLTANSVTAEKITSGAVDTDKLAANAVTAEKVQAGAIDTDKLAANAVTAEKILANSVGAVQIDVQDLAANTARMNELWTGLAVISEAQIDSVLGNSAKFKTINAPLVQSHTQSNRGWKLKPSGEIETYPVSGGGRQFYVGPDGQIEARGVDIEGVLTASADPDSGVRLSSGPVTYREGYNTGDSWELDYRDKTATGPYLKWLRDDVPENESPTLVWDEDGNLVVAPYQSSTGTGAFMVQGPLVAERLIAEGNARVSGNLQAFGTIGTYQGINFPNSYTANRPCFYRRLGNLIFLAGAVNSNVNGNFGGSMAQVPAPASTTQLMAHRTNSSGQWASMPLNIGTDGWMSVPGGSGISSGTPMSLDGLVYIAG